MGVIVCGCSCFHMELPRQWDWDWGSQPLPAHGCTEVKPCLPVWTRNCLKGARGVSKDPLVAFHVSTPWGNRDRLTDSEEKAELRAVGAGDWDWEGLGFTARLDWQTDTDPDGRWIMALVLTGTGNSTGRKRAHQLHAHITSCQRQCQ